MKKLIAVFIMILWVFSHTLAIDVPKLFDKNPKFWIWMHGKKDFTNSDWERVFSRLDDIGFQAILFGGNKEQLKEIIPIAAKHNLEVHKWLWTMNSPGIEKEHPDWLSVNRNGKSLAEEKAYVNYYKFMCPSLPEVQNYLKSKVEELTKIKGLKGIHLDYIRYVDVILPEAIQPNYNIVQDHEFPEYDYGYHPHTRKLYKEKYGIDPIDIKDVENDSNWKQFRYNLITDVVTQLKEVAEKNNVEISSAVFPSPTIARKLVRQDWDKWPIDYVFPMVYQGFYYGDIQWIRKVIQEDVLALKNKKAIYCGLYLPQLKDGLLTKAIEAAFESGASGIAIFDYNGLSEPLAQELKIIFTKYSK